MRNAYEVVLAGSRAVLCQGALQQNPHHLTSRCPHVLKMSCPSHFPFDSKFFPHFREACF